MHDGCGRKYASPVCLVHKGKQNGPFRTVCMGGKTLLLRAYQNPVLLQNNEGSVKLSPVQSSSKARDLYGCSSRSTFPNCILQGQSSFGACLCGLPRSWTVCAVAVFFSWGASNFRPDSLHLSHDEGRWQVLNWKGQNMVAENQQHYSICLSIKQDLPHWEALSHSVTLVEDGYPTWTFAQRNWYKLAFHSIPLHVALQSSCKETA